MARPLIAGASIALFTRFLEVAVCRGPATLTLVQLMPQISKIPRGFRPEPFDYHEEIELEISALTNQGQGLGRLENWVVLVRFALPGERVRARVFKNHSNFSKADLLKVLDPSAHRVEPQCSLFQECGGCQYQNLDYKEQLSWKRHQVEELLEHMADIRFPVNDVVPSPQIYHYRSKITPHFHKPKDGEIPAIGFLRQNGRRDIVDVPACPIASEAINEALPEIRADARKNAASYRRGATLLLRDSAGEVLTDPSATATESVGPLTFGFAAGEFFQNNPHILPAFTEYVATQAAASDASYLVDAYCGSGLFCLTAASRFKRAVGIEISESSVNWACSNASRNKIETARFECGNADSLFVALDFDGADAAVIIDPPRKGCDEAFLHQLHAFAPRTVVYVSCNPSTQMRDLVALLDTGKYRLDAVQPFDLFPHTKHLECVITLNRDE